MMETETIYPIDIQLNILDGNGPKRVEQIWLTASQYEVLEIVSGILGLTFSFYPII